MAPTKGKLHYSGRSEWTQPRQVLPWELPNTHKALEGRWLLPRRVGVSSVEESG